MQDEITNKIKETKRIDWIDMAKGYGIILVMVGHLIPDSLVRYWLYSFHMPLFFFLSGYVLNTNCNFKLFLKKKIKTLIIPFFCMGLIIISYWLYTSRVPNLFFLVRRFSRYFYTELIQQRRGQSIWYLTSLFLTSIVFYFLKKILKTNKKLLIASIISLCIGITYYALIGINLQWNADTVFMAFPIVSLGNYCKSKESKIETILSNKKKVMYLLISFIIINIVYNYITFLLTGQHLDMWANQYGYLPATILSAMGGICATIIISKLKTIKVIKYIGKNSLIYFALHQAIIFPIVSVRLRATSIYSFFKATRFGEIFYVFAMTLITIIILTILNEIISRTKLKFMIGK